MNVVARLTLRHMQANKRRTLVTIAGAIVSVAMITAVLIIAASFMQMFQQTVAAQTGNWQVCYQRTPADKAPLAAQDEETVQLSMAHHEGWIALKDSRDPRRKAMAVQGYTAESFAQLPMEMTAGTYPRNDHELLVSQNFMDTAGFAWQVGDTVTVPWGGYRSQEAGLAEAELTAPDGRVQEALWQPRGEREFVIAGIANMSSNLENTGRDGYIGFTALDLAALGAGETVDIRQQVRTINTGLYQRGEALGERLGAETVSFNNELLVYYGVTSDSAFRNTIVSVVAILALVILVGSVSLIYNAFAISLAERSRMLGMLASVGATRRQKMSSVLFEVLLIGVVALPLGLLCGYLGIVVTFKCLEPILHNTLGMSGGSTVAVVVPVWALVGAVAFQAVVLMISAFLPARRAAKISPIEAIRGTQEIRISAKEVKTSPLTRKIFGFEAELGLKNIKRSRSRYLASLFSLIISVMLFLTASTFTSYMAQSYKMTQSESHYAVVLRAWPYDTASRDALIDALKNQRCSDGVVMTESTMMIAAVPDEAAVAEGDNLIYEQSESGRSLMVSVNFFDEESLRAYGEAAGVDVTPLMTDELRAIVLQPITVKNSHSFSQVMQLRPETTSLSVTRAGWTGEMEIVGSTAELPEVLSGYQEQANVLYVISSMQAADAWSAANAGAEELTFNAMFSTRQSTLLYNDLLELAKQYPGNEITVVDIAGNIRLQEQLQTMLTVFVYGFIALIVLICAANIFNTISTGVLLRTREFAMLRSVGITPGQFNKMVCYESLFYGIKALAYGLPISALIAVLMYRALGSNFDFAFYLPLWAYVTAIAGVLLLVGSTMAYAIRQVKRTNLIDGLKNENL